MSRRLIALGAAACTVVAAALASPTAVASAPADQSSAGATLSPAVAGSPHRYVGTVREGLAAKSARRSTAALYTCQTATPYHCFDPAAMRKAYGVDLLPQNGAGQTVAIVDAFSAPNIESDLASFNQLFGLPSAPLTISYVGGKTPFDPTNANQRGWAGEIALDVQWVHAIAPAASIQLVLAKSDSAKDIYAAQNYAVKKTGATALSLSFGVNEACVGTSMTNKLHKLYAKAKNAGMTVLAAAGDQGAAMLNCSGTAYVQAVSSPAVDDQVTGVGGTLLRAATDGTYTSETTWNEASYHSAGGGGTSTLVSRPSYQAGVSASSKRTLPDVAYNAGIDSGVLTVSSDTGGVSGAVYAFGGTSAGAPQWAGLTALASQRAGHKLGLLNTALYSLAASPTSYAANFRDVTTGDNTYHGTAQTVTGFSAGTGYDLATGLGTPRAQTLVPTLAGG